jgi:hypothetical protein
LEKHNDDFPDAQEGRVRDNPILDQTEGSYHSKWGARGARLGFQGGCVCSLLIAGCSLASWAVRLGSSKHLAIDDLFSSLGVGILITAITSLFLIFVLTVVIGNAGIVLEAVVMSIRGRPKGVERGLALFEASSEEQSRQAQGMKEQPPQQPQQNLNTSFSDSQRKELSLTSDQHHPEIPLDVDTNS